MIASQLRETIKHFEKNLGGAGYFVRVYLVSGDSVFGAIMPSQAGRPATLSLETPNEEDLDGEHQTIFVDIDAITAIKGPFMQWHGEGE